MPGRHGTSLTDPDAFDLPQRPAKVAAIILAIATLTASVIGIVAVALGTHDVRMVYGDATPADSGASPAPGVVRVSARPALIHPSRTSPAAPNHGTHGTRPAAGPSGTTPANPTGTPPATAPAGRRCSASYRVVNRWPGGFRVQVGVTAVGSAISGWTVTWTLPSGQSIGQAWNATVTTSGTVVSATNLSYNATLGAGHSTTFGFAGTGRSANSDPAVRCTAR